MRPTCEIPVDPELPALAAIRSLGLAAAVPALELPRDRAVQLSLCGYTPGERATLDVRVGHRHLAIKAYAVDPAPEVALYQALAVAGLGSGSPVRVPPLLACDQDLKLLAIGWLEGPSANELVKHGLGRRAGELAARWCARSPPVALGAQLNAARRLEHSDRWISRLGTGVSQLGAVAGNLLERLAQSLPVEGPPRLVHGTFYARHVIDLGDALGVIDWQRFAQGPVEIDASAFLTTTWRTGLHDRTLGGEAARAQEAFLAATAGLLNTATLLWYEAAALVDLAAKQVRRHSDWKQRAQGLLFEASRLAAVAGIVVG